MAAHIYFPIRNRRQRKKDRGAWLIARTGLVAVIEFLGQIGRIIGVEHTGRAIILHHPNDGIRCPVGRNAGCGPWIAESGAGSGEGRGDQHPSGERIRLEHISLTLIVNLVIEKRGRTPRSRIGAGDRLNDLAVISGMEMSHIVAV